MRLRHCREEHGKIDVMNDALRKILIALSLASAGMAIYYFISMVIAGDIIHGFVAATSYAVCMLCGAIIGLMAEYTVRVNRDNTDDKNQLNAGMVLVILGAVIATTVSMLGIGGHAPIMIAYYLQTVILFAILLIFRLSYRGKH